MFHHLDVHDHTLEVLDQVVAIERDPFAAGFGEHSEAVAELLREPLADELTRGESMRIAALLHDAAKPWTRIERPGGGFGFPGHDREGARVARDVLRRLRASERLVAHVSALCLHHLRLGFLVHERPLDRRAIWRYLRATEPYAADVTIFTAADRLATRGKNAEPAIGAHMELAREVLGPALARRADGPGRAAAARRRAGARARAAARAGAGRAARAARGGPLRGRHPDARGRAQAGAGAARRLSERTASRQTSVTAATVSKLRFAATSPAEW